MIRLEAGNDAMGSVLWIEALVITLYFVESSAGLLWPESCGVIPWRCEASG